MRRKFSKEFKLDALKLAEKIGIRRASSDLGVPEASLYQWRSSAKNEGADAFRGNGHRTEQEEELRKLRYELKIANEEREILKKATVFFANLQK